jgi:hypothetical protein
VLVMSERVRVREREDVPVIHSVGRRSSNRRRERERERERY